MCQTLGHYFLLLFCINLFHRENFSLFDRCGAYHSSSTWIRTQRCLLSGFAFYTYTFRALYQEKWESDYFVIFLLSRLTDLNLAWKFINQLVLEIAEQTTGNINDLPSTVFIPVHVLSVQTDHNNTEDRHKFKFHKCENPNQTIRRQAR